MGPVVGGPSPQGSAPLHTPILVASRVSSVLNRNTRQFGKKHLFDQDEETCWNSDQVRHPLPGSSTPSVNQNQGSGAP